jgi:hypothetical protein
MWYAFFSTYEDGISEADLFASLGTADTNATNTGETTVNNYGIVTKEGCLGFSHTLRGTSNTHTTQVRASERPRDITITDAYVNFTVSTFGAFGSLMNFIVVTNLATGEMFILNYNESVTLTNPAANNAPNATPAPPQAQQAPVVPTPASTPTPTPQPAPAPTSGTTVVTYVSYEQVAGVYINVTFHEMDGLTDVGFFLWRNGIRPYHWLNDYLCVPFTAHSENRILIITNLVTGEIHRLTEGEHIVLRGN